MSTKHILGIDVGATGIKGAIVDVESGTLLTEKKKYKTPKPTTPDAVLGEIKRMVADFNWEGKQIGMGFPSIIKDGVALSASNIDQAWIGMNVEKFMGDALGVEVDVINDADAAGLAELKFGNIKDTKGLVVFLTLGTGIGSALFLDGKLIRNTEFGQLKYKKTVTEHYASNSARENKGLTWRAWAKELNNVLKYIEFIFSPNLFVLGGGISKDFEQYSQFLQLKTPIKTAKMFNNAGIIGAAMAHDHR